MRLGHLDMWWVATAPLLAAALWVYGSIARRHALQAAGHLPLVQKLLATYSPERRMLKRLIVGLAIALVAVAALRPQFGMRPQPLKRLGIDIAVAFDISKSMLARDIQPARSRLEAAREQLDQLVTLLTGDRVALVPFAGVAFTQSPLTHDNGAIRLYMDSLDPKAMPIGGTNLTMAIEQGIGLLTGRGDKAEQGRRTKVLMLITDGEDVGADEGVAVKEAARKAAEAGVRIFAVAIGTRLGEPIPIYNEDGSHAGYQKDSQGKPIYSKLNLELLEEIADVADPEHADAMRVVHYDGSIGVAPALASELGTLQKSTAEATIRQAYGEKYQYALLPALLLLLIDLLIGERRRTVAAKRTAAETSA